MTDSPVSSTHRRWGHVPVLAAEVVKAFDFGRPALVIDGTLGAGGHTEALLERYPDMRIVGMDWDTLALSTAEERLSRFGERFQSIQSNFADLPARLPVLSPSGIDGLLLDLGLSSLQLEDAQRGFSFLRPGPLDMRMSRELTQTAWDVLRQSSEEELARLFRTYGEEKQSRRIASLLKAALSKGALENDAWKVAEFIRSNAPARGGRIDPSTRCFQALRIAVNHELENLKDLLGQMENVLVPGGRVAVISFHSLEDRLVKRAFQQAAKGCICPPQVPQCVCGKKPWARLIPRKAIQSTADEIAGNPRARSARLRLLEKR
ncbi:MAG: 16S rRNA (cytosine(1402)-N(4))-methyltransferase RsmH [Elusimicrobiota bacterium]|jgi:16S rRNA (cytosine1402-N4)-methyltransferase